MIAASRFAAGRFTGGAAVRENDLTREECGGKCCAYVAVELDEPTSKSDFEDLLYYLHHGGVKVCVATNDDTRTWYLQFDGGCRHLTPDGHCRIYEHRPTICREHSLEGCEYHEAQAFREMETAHDLLAFMGEIGRRKWRKKLAENLPPSLQ